MRAAKLPHVVLLSSVGAQHEKGTGPIQALHHAERELVATGFTRHACWNPVTSKMIPLPDWLKEIMPDADLDPTDR